MSQAVRACLLQSVFAKVADQVETKESWKFKIVTQKTERQCQITKAKEENGRNMSDAQMCLNMYWSIQETNMRHDISNNRETIEESLNDAALV